jgi:putative endonuclease
MYMLECCDGTFYTGSTKDLERRLLEHSSGNGANYTAKRLPVRLIYAEEFERVDDAFYREKQIQNWSHEKKLALIAGDFETVREKGKKKFPRKHGVSDRRE